MRYNIFRKNQGESRMIVWDVVRIYEDMEPFIKLRAQTDSGVQDFAYYPWRDIGEISYSILTKTVIHIEVDIINHTDTILTIDMVV